MATITTNEQPPLLGWTDKTLGMDTHVAEFIKITVEPRLDGFSRIVTERLALVARCYGGIQMPSYMVGYPDDGSIDWQTPRYITPELAQKEVERVFACELQSA